MKTLSKWLMAIGLTLLLASSFAHKENDTVSPWFKYACEDTGIDCTNIRPPIVIFSKIPTAYGNLGMYLFGEPYIFVNTFFLFVPWDEIEYHETVHYVLYEGGHPLAEDTCYSEGVARELTSKRFGTEVDKEWRSEYGCPEQQ